MVNELIKASLYLFNFDYDDDDDDDKDDDINILSLAVILLKLAMIDDLTVCRLLDVYLLRNSLTNFNVLLSSFLSIGTY